MVKRYGTFCFVIVTVIGLSGVYAADLKQYESYLQQKKYRAALSFLKEESARVVAVVSDSLKKAFPKNSGQWTLAPASPFEDEIMLQSSGIMLNLMYNGKTPDQTLSVSLLADHPDIEQYETLIKQAPSQSDGVKSIKTKEGLLGIQKYDASSKTIEVNLLIDGQTLLNLVGTDVRSADDVLNFVADVDLKLIKTLLN